MTFKFKPASPEELARRVTEKPAAEPKKPAPRRRTPAKPKE